jgi:hypothetical protein
MHRFRTAASPNGHRGSSPLRSAKSQRGQGPRLRGQRGLPETHPSKMGPGLETWPSGKAAGLNPDDDGESRCARSIRAVSFRRCERGDGVPRHARQERGPQTPWAVNGPVEQPVEGFVRRSPPQKRTMESWPSGKATRWKRVEAWKRAAQVRILLIPPNRLMPELPESGLGGHELARFVHPERWTGRPTNQIRGEIATLTRLCRRDRTARGH